MSFQGRGSMKHVMAIAKKKPALQNIIDNIESYTSKELENVSGQPKWIRKLLVKHRKETEKREAGYLTPEEIAAIMTKKSNV